LEPRVLMDRIGAKVVSLVVVLTVVFGIAPMIITLLLSFEAGDVMRGIPTEFSLRWYQYFVRSPAYTTSLYTSWEIAALAGLISTVIGILASFAIVRYKYRGKQILTSLATAPIMVPGVVTGFGLLGFFSQIGFSNAFNNLVIAHVVFTIPYVVRTVTATLIGFDQSIEEAAMNLGAGRLRTFVSVTLPLIKPGVIAGVVFAFAESLDDVAVSLFLVNGSTLTLSCTLFAYMKDRMDSSVAVASMIMMSFTLCLIVVVEKVVGLDRFVGLRTVATR
jgi:putative spermidine/putrescine transport system permease protein